jgi:hypothetical protein
MGVNEEKAARGPSRSAVRVAGGAARRAGVVALGCLVALSVGCVGAGVPDWAQHVRPAPVDHTRTAAETAARLRSELGAAGLGRSHLSAEQIALVAVDELERGHDVDAALWLAMASYRYHQQALHASAAGKAGYSELPPGVNVDAYTKLVVAEVVLFAGLEFNQELGVVSARLHGLGEADSALQEQLASLGKRSPLDRESLRDALRELRPNAGAALEVSRYPDLVQAFRSRLLDDFSGRGDDFVPGYYMARTPAAALQADAVLASRSFFDPALCAGVSAAFPAHRPAVVAKLGAPRPEVRANAAAILALAPTPETRALLEQRAAIERHASVKLVLAYALVRHGAPEHLLTVKAALQSCAGKACDLPASLADWLPADARKEMDEAPLARIVAGASFKDRGRRFAVSALEGLQQIRPLAPETVEALFVAARLPADARGEEDRLATDALAVISEATTLTRPQLIARLDGGGKPAAPGAARKDFLFPGPLLARLAKVAEPDDVTLLGAMMDRFGDGQGSESRYIVEAMLRIPGAEADARLVNWFRRFTRPRTLIALGLAARGTLPADRLERVLAAGGAQPQLAVKVATKAPEMEKWLLHYLEHGTTIEKGTAAELAGMVGLAAARPLLRRLLELRDDTYYPTDALVRHAAAGALVRIALAQSRPAADAAAAAGTKSTSTVDPALE